MRRQFVFFLEKNIDQTTKTKAFITTDVLDLSFTDFG